MYAVLKFAITAAIVVAVSEVSKRSTFVGALLVSLPLTSLLAISWLYVDTGDTAKVADLAASILWFVLPSLVFFVVLPAALRREVSFGVSMVVASLATIAAYFAMVAVLKRFGIEL